MKIYDCLIIGGGPAGLTAALYGKRANMDIGFFEKETPGGKLVKTFSIENYPAFESISGPDLALKMFDHATNLGAEMIYADVKNIKLDGKYRIVVTADGAEYKAKTIIVCSGMKERKIGVPGEDKYYGLGVSYCAICDAALYKNSEVIVVGGGNSAIEEGMYLADVVKKVHLVHRRDVFRADPLSLEKFKAKPNIEFHIPYVVKEVKGDKKAHEVVIENLDTKELKTIKMGCLFPYIGLDPITYFVKDLDILDKEGFIITNEKMETKIPGIYSAGDVNKKPLRQVATAISDGATACVVAKAYIDNNF